VVYVPFAKGRPTGKPVDILAGFHTPDESEVWGRPVATILDRTGALLVSDDVGNKIWRVSATNPAPVAPPTAVASR
jgi:glucose/arabinose dehydrogenase